ncbi:MULTISPECIES: PepSY domain-containing protein [Bacillaceae]|uniref:PepSY domain-containing protein n=1 Tax=Bacillaceae TaxID=186817 RepID=UPI001E49594D|nr:MULTISPECIES: PepSY domain-containing protein [Bacillaceae]MCE4051297.1 PepSY domain-containing protein [Bacillus sp. Au-Bac7]MCM3032202.1 PepSY domain-containing protein [Niallia sp. MER 6]MDL0436723.1 PepSY domain-containing protein [Niallia sp. SS-2023]UPO86893.1 PepSY domain-containing protein [Niallia sp. Man26]
MNWKTIVAGAAVGFAASYAVKEAVSRNYSLSSDRVLKIVKAVFKEQGPITGSWINMQKEPYETAGTTQLIYRGGITRDNDGKNESFEFLADSKTGNLLDIYEL